MSAHFPRITKHDLEVVVEAMDKLRAAIAAASENQSVAEPDADVQRITKDIEVALSILDREAYDRAVKQLIHVAASKSEAKKDPPSVDGLEAQCYALVKRIESINEAWEVAEEIAAFIRNRDRELVELAEKWDKENSLRSDDSYRYPQQLRAVLAARNEVGK